MLRNIIKYYFHNKVCKRHIFKKRKNNRRTAYIARYTACSNDAISFIMIYLAVDCSFFAIQALVFLIYLHLEYRFILFCFSSVFSLSHKLHRFSITASQSPRLRARSLITFFQDLIIHLKGAILCKRKL